MDGKSLLGPFVSLNDALDPLKPAAKRFSFYASRARKFIVQETNRCCEKSLDRYNRPMVNALAELAERSRLRLMSLNYDDLPAASGIQFFTGFVADDAPYQRFVTTPAWPEDQHTWCQLHGSVLFRVKSHAEHGISSISKFTRSGAPEVGRQCRLVSLPRRPQERIISYNYWTAKDRRNSE